MTEQCVIERYAASKRSITIFSAEAFSWIMHSPELVLLTIYDLG